MGFKRGDDGELIPHEAEQEAVREMVALRDQGRPLRAIAEAVKAKGHKLSHEGVAGVLRSRLGWEGKRAITVARRWRSAATLGIYSHHAIGKTRAGAGDPKRFYCLKYDPAQRVWEL